MNQGTPNCYHSLLRPVLGSDSLWYSCCGNQYMLPKPAWRYVMPMSQLPYADGLAEISLKQKWFDGSVCAKCYYELYNMLLTTLLSDVKHKRFI